MLRATERLERAIPGGSPETGVTGTLTLPFALRQKSRLRARLEDGREVALVLPRGGVLRDGDLLRTEDDQVLRVRAAHEDVSTARSDDPLRLARAAYHLGNRHVALEIQAGRLHYLRDHVLDAMVKELGLEVSAETRPFEPEAGAYAHAH